MKKFAAILLAVVMMLSMSAMAATITVTPPTLTEGADQTGITYNAYKVFDAVISGDNVAYTIDSTSPFYSVISTCNYFTLEQLNGSTTWMVTANTLGADESAAVKDLAAKLNAVSNKTVAGTATVTGNTAATLELDAGYYLITSTIGDALILDTTRNDAIATKNTYPSLEKTADKTTADLGDTVTFTITVTIPENASGEIVVHDTMTGLDYTGLTDDSDAGVTATETTGDDCTVHFTIDETTVAAGGTVTIKYTAVVTADTANNEAYLQDDTFTTKPTKVIVKNYKLDVFKYTNGENDSKVGLADAGFVLMNADGEYYKYTAATDTTAAKVEWVVSIADATEYTTAADNNYTVQFVGLANGTYTLVEKTVPAGYNAMQDKTVIIENADQTGTAQVEVENKTGSELPSTGGMGTTVFYVVGGLMMAAAVVLLVARKKVAAK